MPLLVGGRLDGGKKVGIGGRRIHPLSGGAVSQSTHFLVLGSKLVENVKLLFLDLAFVLFKSHNQKF